MATAATAPSTPIHQRIHRPYSSFSGHELIHTPPSRDRRNPDVQKSSPTFQVVVSPVRPIIDSPSTGRGQVHQSGTPNSNETHLGRVSGRRRAGRRVSISSAPQSPTFSVAVPATSSVEKAEELESPNDSSPQRPQWTSSFTSPDTRKKARLEATCIAEEPEVAKDGLIGKTLDGSYTILKRLGEGSFSTTFLAEQTGPKETHRRRLVAVKRFNGSWISEMGEHEFRILSELSQNCKSIRHLIQPVSYFHSDVRGESEFYLVLESLDSARHVALPDNCCCSHVDTSHLTLACPSRAYLFQKLVLQLLTGVYELHKNGFIHTDLTPDNILYLPTSNRIKIIDLGNAIRTSEIQEDENETYEMQSAHFRAPEILLGAGPITPAIDIWSVGVIALGWFLGTEGRNRLERVIDDDVEEGVEYGNAPVMAVKSPSRMLLVKRMIRLFGSVTCYKTGMFYTEEYTSLCEDTGLGVLGAFLTQETGGDELAIFMGQLLATDVRDRNPAKELLGHPWLVRGLLGTWADVLAAKDIIQTYKQTSITERVVPRLATPGSELTSAVEKTHIPQPFDELQMTDTTTVSASEEHGTSTVSEAEDDLTLVNVPGSHEVEANSETTSRLSRKRRRVEFGSDDNTVVPFVSPTPFPFTYTKFSFSSAESDRTFEDDQDQLHQSEEYAADTAKRTRLDDKEGSTTAVEDLSVGPVSEEQDPTQILTRLAESEVWHMDLKVAVHVRGLPSLQGLLS